VVSQLVGQLDPRSPSTARTPVLLAVTGSAVVWLAMTWIAGGLSDTIGRRHTHIIGWIVPGLDPLLRGVDHLRARRDPRCAFAPSIATWLVQTTGSSASVAFYIATVTLIAFAATLLLRDRTGIPLGPEHEAQQARGQIYGMAR
jgi:hypothetical protein